MVVIQRPLVGEPLSLDLVNTEWFEDGQRQDLLNTVADTVAWLEEVGLGQRITAPLEDVRTALLEVRAAIRRVLEYSSNAAACDGLNAILSRGQMLYQLKPNGPEVFIEVPETWYPAWIAAKNYIDLLQTSPERIRPCAHPDCILYFLDTSKNGTRRWCNMKTCGNRNKAKHHYQRSKTRQSAVAEHLQHSNSHYDF